MTIIAIGFGSGADVVKLKSIAMSPQHYVYAILGSLAGLFAK